jgi:glutamate racemase
MPEESYLYVADSHHAPYGPRSKNFLQKRAQTLLTFFEHRNVKALVLACNTISAAASELLRSTTSVPIVAMEPAIKPATRLTRSGTVLVLATAFTVQSQTVARLCRLFGHEAKVLLQACPGLVEQVEAGKFGSETTFDLLRTYIRPGVDSGADTIVLGCTHYAFLEKQIAEVAGPTVCIVEPSQAIARQLECRLQGNRTLQSSPSEPTAFFTSGSVHKLRTLLQTLGENATYVEQM